MNQRLASQAQLPLKQRLLRYLQKRQGVWIASGDLQRLVTENTSYTAANATRRLRELVEEGELEVEYRKNHAFYRSGKPQTVRRVEIRDGRAVEIIETVSM